MNQFLTTTALTLIGAALLVQPAQAQLNIGAGGTTAGKSGVSIGTGGIGTNARIGGSMVGNSVDTDIGTHIRSDAARINTGAEAARNDSARINTHTGVEGGTNIDEDAITRSGGVRAGTGIDANVRRIDDTIDRNARLHDRTIDHVANPNPTIGGSIDAATDATVSGANRTLNMRTDKNVRLRNDMDLLRNEARTSATGDASATVNHGVRVLHGTSAGQIAPAAGTGVVGAGSSIR